MREGPSVRKIKILAGNAKGLYIKFRERGPRNAAKAEKSLIKKKQKKTEGMSKKKGRE